MANYLGATIVAAVTGFFRFDASSPGQAGGSMLLALPFTVGQLTAPGSTTPVVVAAPAVTPTSDINLTPATPGGTLAGFNITAITPGVGFSVTFGAADTTVYNYSITG